MGGSKIQQAQQAQQVAMLISAAIWNLIEVHSNFNQFAVAIDKTIDTMLKVVGPDITDAMIVRTFEKRKIAASPQALNSGLKQFLASLEQKHIIQGKFYAGRDIIKYAVKQQGLQAVRLLFTRRPPFTFAHEKLDKLTLTAAFKRKGEVVNFANDTGLAEKPAGRSAQFAQMKPKKMLSAQKAGAAAKMAACAPVQNDIDIPNGFFASTHTLHSQPCAQSTGMHSTDNSLKTPNELEESIDIFISFLRTQDRKSAEFSLETRIILKRTLLDKSPEFLTVMLEKIGAIKDLIKSVGRKPAELVLIKIVEAPGASATICLENLRDELKAFDQQPGKKNPARVNEYIRALISKYFPMQNKGCALLRASPRHATPQMPLDLTGLNVLATAAELHPNISSKPKVTKFS